MKDFFLKILTRISPILNTQLWYRHRFGRWPDLIHPQTFNEKVLWLKLNTYSHDPLATQCADKYAVREYVRQQGCAEILNPIYGAWSDPDAIDFEALPDKFVLKSNYFYHMNLVVPDKSKLDIPATRQLLRRWMADDGHLVRSEMQYAGIPKKVIAEQFIETQDGAAPIDYKVYCSYGKPSYVMTCIGRTADQVPLFYFYDLEGNLMRTFSREGAAVPKDYSYAKPQGWEQMLAYARKLSAPFPFVRVDFYIEAGQVIFGELTFTPCSGLDTDLTPEAEKELAATVTLPIAGKR